MIELPTDLSISDALRNYIGYQIAASLFIGLAGIFIGMFIAWLSWGKPSRNLSQIREQNTQLQREWQQLLDENADLANDKDQQEASLS